MTPKSSAPTALDLFSGAGGLSAGLALAGFDTIYANEINQVYARTYAANHPSVPVDSRDIRLVDPRRVRRELGVERGELDLVAGGPPCQGFSINAPERSDGDHRNHLFREYLRFVEEFRPRSVLIENVPGLVSFSGGATLSAILEALDGLGYMGDVRILYAPHYGVPQTRWRTIVTGIRHDLESRVEFPRPTHEAPFRVNFTSTHGRRNLIEIPSGSGLLPFVSVRDAIGDLPSLANGGAVSDGSPYGSLPSSAFQSFVRREAVGVWNHVAPALGALNVARIRHVPPGGNWTDIPEALLPRGMQRARRSDHTKRYGRVEAEGLASTILTKCDPHWGAYIHWQQDRVFTVREAARLQSFPDSYRFLGSRGEQYAQVGNAVPPLLARAVGEAMRDALRGSERARKGVTRADSRS